MTRRRPPHDAPGPGFELRIGELVIDGYALREGRMVAAALEQELDRLLGDAAPPFAETSGRRARDLTFDRLDAGTVTHAPGASPRAVGRSAARAIVQRLRTLSTGHDAAPRRRGAA
jgi:hypothetical protein